MQEITEKGEMVRENRERGDGNREQRKGRLKKEQRKARGQEKTEKGEMARENRERGDRQEIAEKVEMEEKG